MDWEKREEHDGAFIYHVFGWKIGKTPSPPSSSLIGKTLPGRSPLASPRFPLSASWTSSTTSSPSRSSLTSANSHV
ncbi:hypothetical protein glysoja_006720 [Glycine soja]|nr:hypothetical protein glysoja_006720 [Glycine soja]